MRCPPGSGGHTAEMFYLLDTLPWEAFAPTYVVADTDKGSVPFHRLPCSALKKQSNFFGWHAVTRGACRQSKDSARFLLLKFSFMFHCAFNLLISYDF